MDFRPLGMETLNPILQASGHTYLLDGKLFSRCLAVFAGPRLPTPLRISFRPSLVRLADVRRRSSTCRRRAILL